MNEPRDVDVAPVAQGSDSLVGTQHLPAAPAPEPLRHPLLHEGPVGAHLRERRPGEQAAPGALVPGPDRLVVRVEQVGVTRVEAAILRRGPGKHELLEEPGGVGEVPLDRARVRHRLNLLVLGAERSGQRGGSAAHRKKAVEESGGAGRIGPAASPAWSDLGRGRVHHSEC